MKVIPQSLALFHLQGGPLKRIIRLLLTMALFFLSTIGDAYGDTTNVMIILDASGSMAGRTEGRAKIDVAKEAILSVVKTLPQDVRVGLRVYGHQYHKSLHNCLDSNLEVPLDFVNPGKIAKVLKWIGPRGYTPLAYSMAQVTNDFIYPGDNVVICVTDGIETCGGDPCAVADSLSRSEISVVFHVVGFNVNEADKDILLCIPRNSGGHYFSATNPAELNKALEDVFELSIKPGFLKLGFSGIEDREEFIYGALFADSAQYMFKNATTRFYTALPPGMFQVTNFKLKSELDFNPFCPEHITLDSVEIKSGKYTTLPLDDFAIVQAHFILPPELPEKTVLSIIDHRPHRFIPDCDVDFEYKVLLIRPGKYNFVCESQGEGYLKTVSLNGKSYLPQTFNEITFDLTVDKKIPWWPLLILIIPLIMLVKFLSKLRGSSKVSPIEEFVRSPEKFKGSVVTLELRISDKDKGFGKTIQFWNYFPVEVTVQVFVPTKFASLKNFDTRYKIKISFLCKEGRSDSGNILVAYKKGAKI